MLLETFQIIITTNEHERFLVSEAQHIEPPSQFKYTSFELLETKLVFVTSQDDAKTGFASNDSEAVFGKNQFWNR